MQMDVKHLGQVFTPDTIVSNMLKLIKNKGRILEPSCGDGSFSKHLKNCVSIEYDKTKCPTYALNMDFFDYPLNEKFDTIIGNPPYVRYQDILDDTKGKLDKTLFDERSNLYLFFIHKCILHLKDKGELIFIVPRSFLKLTSAIKLNNFIYKQGSITHITDLGDTSLFKDANPNTVIFRFEKGNFDRITDDNKKFTVINGQILFISDSYNVKFNELFFVKVGAVSGKDKIFKNPNGNVEFVCSATCKTGKTKRMFYNIKSKELEKYKDELLKRKLKSFNEDNWYMWGRNYYKSDSKRIYVNCKTRNKNPFFYHECNAYDGSILAIFPKFEVTKELLHILIDELNSVDWNQLGFVCDGRFIFSQKSLENTILPNNFKKYLKNKE